MSFECFSHYIHILQLLSKQIIEFTSESRYALKVLHTPGHTMESVVYLLIDKLNDNKPLKVLI